MKLIGIGDDIFARIGIRIGIESGLVCIYFSVDQDKNNEKFISELVLQEFFVTGYILTGHVDNRAKRIRPSQRSLEIEILSRVQENRIYCRRLPISIGQKFSIHQNKRINLTENIHQK